MRRFLLVLVGLLATTVAGCSVLDSVFLNPETKMALAGLEKAKADLATAKAEAEAAKTVDEKLAAEAKLSVAVKAAEEAGANLDKALESNSPSTAESLAALASNFGFPWLVAIVGGASTVYAGIRAKNNGKIAKGAFEVIEGAGETEPGKALKKKLGKKFEESGVASHADTILRKLGYLKKSVA